MQSIMEALGRLLDDREKFVLATIISRHGSTPRTAGTRMIICRNKKIFGTIGGGLLEARVIERAAQVLSSGQAQILPFDMTYSELSSMDMVCGGEMEVLIKPVDPKSPSAEVFKRLKDVWDGRKAHFFLTTFQLAENRVGAIHHCLVRDCEVICGSFPLEHPSPDALARDHEDALCLRTICAGDFIILLDPVLSANKLHLFGAGHVAKPTARMAAMVGFEVEVLDDREEFANARRFPEARRIRVFPDFDTALKEADVDGESFIVIVTRGHLHDKTILAQALKTNAAYIGMIGSRRKRDHIFNALLKQGYTESDLKRVHSPVGLAIGAQTPEEIAVSIVAEMIQVRAQRRDS